MLLEILRLKGWLKVVPTGYNRVSYQLTQEGFEILKRYREVIQSFQVEEDRFGVEPEITAKVARGGWRVYEVGISYAGRTYAEGKKIGWRDGIRAFYCIVRYSGLFERGARMRRRVPPPAGFDEADSELALMLDDLDGVSPLETVSPPHSREVS